MLYLQPRDTPSKHHYRIHCRTWTQALGEFYSQWRDETGAIPWVIVADGHTITEEDLRT
jgi:hypothetical protein